MPVFTIPNPRLRYNFDPTDLQPAAPPPSFQGNEDGWQNPVAPVAATNYVALPYQPDPELVPAGNLLIFLGSGDGSRSTAGYIKGDNGRIINYSFDPDFPAHSGFVQVFTPDEDFWVSGVPPTIPEPTLLWFSDDISAYPVIDEDYWQNAVPATPQTFALLHQSAFETNEFVPAPFFAGQADEDFWINPVAPLDRVLRALHQWPFDPEQPGQFSGQPDEDFWVSGVAPVPPGYALFFPFNLDDQLIFTPQVPGDDSEFWLNPVSPVAASMYQRLPYYHAEDQWLTLPVIAPTGQGGYLIYGLQTLNKHVSHI